MSRHEKTHGIGTFAPNQEQYLQLTFDYRGSFSRPDLGEAVLGHENA